MTTEAWDPSEIEREWSDALALLGELVPTVDEVAETFRSEVFVANVTNDDDRLAESWSWRQNVSWSDEARAAMRVPGNVPGPDRTVTIRKDDESLARRGRESF